MKRIILFSLFILSLMGHNYVHAHDDLIDYINIRHVPHGGTHNNLPLPADMPDVYYDNSNQQIIVDGLGVVTYYDVDDETVSMSDITALIDYMMNQLQGMSQYQLDSADVNRDGQISLADVSALTDLLSSN